MRLMQAVLGEALPSRVEEQKVPNAGAWCRRMIPACLVAAAPLALPDPLSLVPAVVRSLGVAPSHFDKRLHFDRFES